MTTIQGSLPALRPSIERSTPPAAAPRLVPRFLDVQFGGSAKRGGFSRGFCVAFALLLLRISLSLMLCGSVTFAIGLVLMPWIFGLSIFFYCVGFVSNLSWLGRAVLMGNPSPPPPPPSAARKERPIQKGKDINCITQQSGIQFSSGSK